MELNELFTALALCQGEIENANKSVENKFFKSSYADLAEVINAAKLPLSKNGLSIVQLPSFDAGVVSVKTMLCHKSGQYIESVISTPIAKQDPQSIGSAITYMRRYSYSAMVGIAQEDDDGNKAAGNDTAPKQDTKLTKKASSEQIALILDLATKTNSVVADIAKAYKCTMVNDLSEIDAIGVVNILQKRLEAKNATS